MAHQSMQLLFSTDIAIKALTYMALLDDESVTITQLCKVFGQNQQAYRRPFSLLVEKGIILSQQGRGGGFRLKENPRNIYLGEVINLLETDMYIIPLLEPIQGDAIQHPNSIYRFAAEHARVAFLLKFDNFTIADLAADPYTLAAFGIDKIYERIRLNKRT